MTEALQQHDEPTALPETIAIGETTYTVLYPDLVRPLTPREYQDLKNSIRKRGITMPVVIDEENGIIDGANRTRIAAELGFPVLHHQVVEIAPDKKRELAVSLNIDRRHLAISERQALVDARRQRVKKARIQGRSLRTIAEEEGVSESQIRKDLAVSPAHQCAPEPPSVAKPRPSTQPKISGKDGKTYPANKQKNEKPYQRKPVKIETENNKIVQRMVEVVRRLPRPSAAQKPSVGISRSSLKRVGRFGSRSQHRRDGHFPGAGKIQRSRGPAMRLATPSQADALLARARRLLSGHRTRAKRDGAALDYDLIDLRQLLATSPLCEYCRTPLSFAASMDHRTPIARGGKHALGNLVVACDRCNRIKGQLDADEFALLWELLARLHPVARADIERRLLAGGKRYSGRG